MASCASGTPGEAALLEGGEGGAKGCNTLVYSMGAMITPGDVLWAAAVANNSRSFDANKGSGNLDVQDSRWG
jgi:hypothetical protein